MDFSVYLARQPIFDKEGRIFAYELFYRDTANNTAAVNDNLHATSRVLVNTLNYIGLNALTHGSEAFIKVDDKMLLEEIIHTIFPPYFVLEILETAVITEELIDRIYTLRTKGYRFALNHSDHTSDFISRFHSLLEVMDYVKIDLNRAIDPAKIISDFAHYKCKFIAEKIENLASFELAIFYGFDYFQGYYFCVPDLLKKENFDPDNTLLLDLIYLLQTQAPLEELLEKFDASPYLTINLLKFIQLNEGLHGSVSSIEQALLLIGRERLSNWLELMFYAGRENDAAVLNVHAKLITSQALQRACLMEELASNIKKATYYTDMAYITGILSIAEIMFHDSFSELMKQIKVDPKIVQALVYKTGELGRLLEMAIAIEKNDQQEIGSLLLELDISERELNKALLSSYRRSSAAYIQKLSW